MEGWQAAPGQTLLVPSGPGLHLFFLILGPVTLADYGRVPQVALVGATTLRDGIPHDTACVLEAGEHAFIQHRSYLAYRYMRLDSTPACREDGPWRGVEAARSLLAGSPEAHRRRRLPIAADAAGVQAHLRVPVS